MSNTYSYFTRSVMREIYSMECKAFVLTQMIDNCYDSVCSCEPRSMIGRSWWKQRGYNSPCSCLKTKLQNDLNKVNDEFNTFLNKNTEIKLSLLILNTHDPSLNYRAILGRDEIEWILELY